MALNPIRASLQFDLDTNALLLVETANIQGQRFVVVNISPGGVRRGKNVTVYLERAKALALASDLEEAARGA